jgi:hypothetical protein
VFNTNKLRVKGSVFFSIVRGTFHSLEKKGGVCRWKVKVEWLSLVTAPLSVSVGVGSPSYGAVWLLGHAQWPGNTFVPIKAARPSAQYVEGV